MVFVACGLNHKTAPINVREKIALSPATQDLVLHKLLNLPEINEAFLLSTCNRTEIYCDTHDPQVILHWLVKEYQIPLDAFYVHKGSKGIRHLLRVATGLDSMMLGEPQILGQMKQAYQQACSLNAINTELRPIFEYVFSAAKRVRTHSSVGANPVSVAYAAAQLISRGFTDYRSLNVFLIGSGETAALVAKYLRQQGVERFMIASRTLENAEKLANTFNGQTVPLTDIAQYLPQADVIVSATNCPIHFINKDCVEQALVQRNHKPMLFLDLSVPRDVEEQIKDLSSVSLFNIDDLQALVNKGMEERRYAAIQAEQLIDEELNNYIRKHRSLNAKKFICDYRSQMHDLAQKELQRALKKLSEGQCQQLVLNEFSQRLVNKLTHNPTAGLTQIAKDGREDLFTLAQYLFNTTTHQRSYEEIS